VPVRSRVAQNHTTKLSLIGIFLSTFLAFVVQPRVRRRHARSLDLSLVDLLLLVVSTFRLGRLVAFDKVFDPVRAPFTVTREDEYGAGDVVEARGMGVRRALGELMSCPICAGTWIAAGLVYALHLFPGAARVFMTIMSTIGLAEMLDALTERWTWTGRAARKLAGDEGSNGQVSSAFLRREIVRR
jgi:hypothetical protein